MKKIFKKLSVVVLSALVLCVSAVVSGCSDFSFNPIGEWVNTKCIINGAEFTYGDAETCFVFRHNGTAYMTIDGEYVEHSEYTYTYDDEKLVITSTDRNLSTEYTVKDNGTVLENINSDGFVFVYERK